jgi:HD-GYP domain-containing protein (c-di-GMP phosphodiesterase class II)
MDLKISSVHDIGVGCLLHDIGLNYMAIEYDNRDVGTLDRQELMEYKKHPVYGYSSLRYETWLTELSKDIILYHHEKMDGSGFPTGKKDIPYECRIVNVCDTFDEMICGIGRARVKVHEAVEYLKNFSGILFDERAVDTFLGFTAVYPAGSHVVTNEGEVAVVLSQNADFPDRPVIQILKDRDGREAKEEIIKDLVKVHNVFIEKAID